MTPKKPLHYSYTVVPLLIWISIPLIWISIPLCSFVPNLVLYKSLSERFYLIQGIDYNNLSKMGVSTPNALWNRPKIFT